MRNSNTFICQLSEEEQASIVKEIRYAMEENGFDSATIEDAVSNALQDRLWTVDHIVDIWKYLHPGETDPVPEWRFGVVTNIQCIVFDANGEESYTEDMSGLEAAWEIRRYLNSKGFKPLYTDDGELSGFRQKDGWTFHYCDCDEQTYPELYPDV